MSSAANKLNALIGQVILKQADATGRYGALLEVMVGQQDLLVQMIEIQLSNRDPKEAEQQLKLVMRQVMMVRDRLKLLSALA